MENFLNSDQVKELEEKKWVVNPKCFFITLYADEYNISTWNRMCNIAGVDTKVKELTILSVGSQIKY